MKIAIMQPYLFPYIGYFSLIKNTDHFVFFDTPQYIRKGWINRKRIFILRYLLKNAQEKRLSKR